LDQPTRFDFFFFGLADNAPVSRAVVVAAALFSVAFGFRGRFLDLGLSYEASLPAPTRCS
jgi:hypothetical protein